MNSEESARACAAMVNAYWRRFGFEARAVPVKHETVRKEVVWKIESVLLNGLPPGCDSRQVPLLNTPKEAEQ